MRCYSKSQTDQDKVLDDCCHVTSASGTLCSEGHVIIFNFTAINLITIKLAFIQLACIMSSFAITTNPDYALSGSCQRLNTPWSPQYRGKWCSYLTESLDESTIKVRKSEEHLDDSYWLGLRPLLNCLDFFVLHADAFQGHHIAEEPNLLLMKLTLLQVGKQ